MIVVHRTYPGEVLRLLPVGGEMSFLNRSGDGVRYRNLGGGYFKHIGGETERLGLDQMIEEMEEATTYSVTPPEGERMLILLSPDD